MQLLALNEVGIVKLTVKIGDQEIEMTLDEARVLHDSLGRIFGQPQPTYIPYLVPYPPTPSYPTFEPPLQVTWGNTGGSGRFQ
jgi:hypothetical protein